MVSYARRRPGRVHPLAEGMTGSTSFEGKPGPVWTLMVAFRISELVVSTDIAGLSIVPSSIALAGAEVELAPLSQRERRL